jgi:hypothetical protein
MLNSKALAASVSAAPAVYVEDVFSTFLYTGNGTTQTITNGIDLAGKGGLVWIKGRSVAYDHCLQDTTRGANKILFSNLTLAEQNDTNAITTFNSTGWDMDAESGINANNQTFASWTFREQPKFFDVVTGTADGSGNVSFNHNLGSTPGCVIIKSTTNGSQWFVYHTSLGTSQSILLNSTNAAQNQGAGFVTVSSTSFSMNIGFGAGAVGYVAYLFAHNAGGFGTAGTDNVVSCGSFSGTGFVNLGWEPQWILIKPYSQTYNWEIYDNMRGMGQPAGASSGQVLRPNTSGAEAGGSGISFEATGFTQTTFGASYPYIYIAIRRGPMKTPTDATKVFYPLARTGTAADTTITGAGFPPDAHLNSVRNVTNNGFNALFLDKLRGPNISLIPLSTDAETLTTNTLNSFNQDGVTYGMGSNINSNTKNYINWMFRRAPGFFDVVAWTASASTTISHGLGVIPELIIAKCRSLAGESWTVYTQAGGRSNVLFLDTTNSNTGIASYWGTTGPSSTTFGVAASGSSNNAGNMIAYLFATLAGVSKVGNYTGTGTTLQINCGFTAGARFVMIKRTDSTGDWYVWDTARGIISGNDSYLLLNSTAAEVTGTDYIDPLSSGFEISSTAPAAINANGGSFIFLAIA